MTKKAYGVLGALLLCAAVFAAAPAAAQTPQAALTARRQADGGILWQGAPPAFAPEYAAPPAPGDRLATPTNVRWHTDQDGAVLPGAVAWDTVLEADRYAYTLSRDGAVLQQGAFHASLGLIPSYPAYAFINESGVYTFTVRAQSAAGVYAESDTAAAEFAYARPAQALGQAAALHWEGSKAVFTSPGANGYKVNLYRQENGAMVLANAYWTARPGLNVVGTYAQEAADSFSWLPDGRYCFTVQLLSADILTTANGAESAPSDAVTVRGHKVYGREGAERFVTRLYEVCLGRQPDAAGFEGWVTALATGSNTGSEAACGFIFSDEFKAKNYCNSCYIDHLYSAFMGREPDTEGHAAWMRVLEEEGQSREHVFNGFVGSNEFKAICAQYGIDPGTGTAEPEGVGTVRRGTCAGCGATDGVEDFVVRLYRVCLDRDPDENAQAWMENLRTRQETGRQVAEGFIFSDEFKARGFDNETFVQYLYRAFFDRVPKDGEEGGWVAQLNGGGSRETVMPGFTGSDEFAVLCRRYGIRAQ